MMDPRWRGALLGFLGLVLIQPRQGLNEKQAWKFRNPDPVFGEVVFVDGLTARQKQP